MLHPRWGHLGKRDFPEASWPWIRSSLCSCCLLSPAEKNGEVLGFSKEIYSLDKDWVYPRIQKLAGMGQFWGVLRKYFLDKDQVYPGIQKLAGMWTLWDAPRKYSLDKVQFYPEMKKLAGMGQFWGVPRKNSLDKDQGSSPGQAELGKGTQSFGISWFHLKLWDFSAPSCPCSGREESPREKFGICLRNLGKRSSCIPRTVPEALILSGSTQQEFLDLFSMWEWIFCGVVICLSGLQHQPCKSYQNFISRGKKSPGSSGRIPSFLCFLGAVGFPVSHNF